MQVGTLYKHSYAPGHIFKLVEKCPEIVFIGIDVVSSGTGFGADVNTGRVLYHAFEFTTPIPTSSLFLKLLGVK